MSLRSPLRLLVCMLLPISIFVEPTATGTAVAGAAAPPAAVPKAFVAVSKLAVDAAHSMLSHALLVSYHIYKQDAHACRGFSVLEVLATMSNASHIATCYATHCKAATPQASTKHQAAAKQDSPSPRIAFNTLLSKSSGLKQLDVSVGTALVKQGVLLECVKVCNIQAEIGGPEPTRRLRFSGEPRSRLRATLWGLEAELLN